MSKQISESQKKASYIEIIKTIPSLCDQNWLTNSSNLSALLNEWIGNINWVGFYFVKNSELILGPFQGKVACSPIPFGKGVCGACQQEGKTILVQNVHLFNDHIACDSNSKSEIVIPIFNQGKMFALLDIDSPILNRFDETDQFYLEEIATMISSLINPNFE